MVRRVGRQGKVYAPYAVGVCPSMEAQLNNFDMLVIFIVVRRKALVPNY